MATDVLMPKWGLTMKTGKLARWFKAEGDRVAKGEVLFEVETDKITNSVESPAGGILARILVSAGQTVPVQTIVAVVAEPGEAPVQSADSDQPAATPLKPAPSADKPKPDDRRRRARPFVRATPLARRMARERGIDLAEITGSGPHGRITKADVMAFQPPQDSTSDVLVNASPGAVKTARRAGIDLAQVAGSGPDGRITKADVLRAMHPSAAHPSGSTRASAPSRTAGGVIPMDGIRQTIADNMMTSLHNSAQLSVFVEFDTTATHALRDKIRSRYSQADHPRISFTDIAAMALSRAFKDHPIMNSWLTNEGIVVHEHVNLGIAVALPDGLVVPNIKNAHRKGLLELAAERRQLIRRAHRGTLTLDDVQGGTFTISNVSMLGVDGFTPILNPPETGILGIGRAVAKPAVYDGKICIRTLMTLSLTFDHRVVDGAPAMQFLRTLADYLEDPSMILS